MKRRLDCVLLTLLSAGMLVWVIVSLLSRPTASVEADSDSQTQNEPPAGSILEELASASSPISRNIELVGQIGGKISAVAVSGTLAYLGYGPSLVILDITDPAHPIIVGQSSPRADLIGNVVVVGQQAYVTDNSSGLSIIDVSNPAHPMQTGFYLMPEPAYDVAAAGQYVYIADGSQGLLVIDVSNPAAPTVAGSYNPVFAMDMVMKDHYVYATGSGGLRIIDVSEPSAPTLVGTYSTSGTATKIDLTGHYAYIWEENAGWHTVDISDPFSPTRVAFYPRSGDENMNSLEIEGHYAYVGMDDARLNIMDVSDPARPAQLVAYDTGGNICGIAVAGQHAYITLQSRNNFSVSGLLILDVTNLPNLASVGFYDTIEEAKSVAVGDHHAYIAAWMDGLRIIETSNPAAPNQIGAYKSLMQAQSVDVAGNYAYVADRLSGFHIMDVSNPVTPTEVGFYNVLGSDRWDVVVAGDYAYLYGSNLDIVNVSNPATPTRAGFYTVSKQIIGLAVSGQHVYFTTADGLHIIDVSNPVSPTEVGFYSIFAATDVASVGQYVYVTSGYNGLRIIDVSNPVSPTEVGYYNVPGYAWGVVAAGHYAYVITMDGGPYVHNGGLYVIDLSNLAGPSEVGFYDIQAVSDIAMAGQYVYVIGESNGLWILRCLDCLPNAPRFSEPVCGTTNRVMPTIRGLAYPGDTISLYLDGSFAISATLTGSTFVFTPTLSPSAHIFTATATTAQGTSPASDPLRLTVSPTLAYDPVGVAFSYPAPWGTATGHPREASGCADPDGWRVWLRSAYTTTVAVPVNYTNSAIVTMALGDQTHMVTDLVGSLHLPLMATFTPPIRSGTFAITVTADGQTSTATGATLIDPDGYVFDKNVWNSQGITLTLAGITVTCEYSDTATNKWTVWQAWAYDQQVNPQVTGEDGYYAFFVPPGMYRITASHPDYWPYTSPDIVVVDAPARLNIPLALMRRWYLPMVVRN